jgi:hypothetical protein
VGVLSGVSGTSYHGQWRMDKKNGSGVRIWPLVIAVCVCVFVGVCVVCVSGTLYHGQ